MITKKDWDNLPLETKREILATIFGDDFEQHLAPKKLLYAYHHNFDFDDTGKRLKKVLQQLYRIDSEKLYVKVEISHTNSPRAKFLANPEDPKKVAKTPTNKVTPVERRRWYCDYIAKGDGDVCHVWCEADSKEEARYYFLGEYWDIDEIISIHK